MALAGAAAAPPPPPPQPTEAFVLANALPLPKQKPRRSVDVNALVVDLSDSDHSGDEGDEDAELVVASAVVEHAHTPQGSARHVVHMVVEDDAGTCLGSNMDMFPCSQKGAADDGFDEEDEAFFMQEFRKSAAVQKLIADGVDLRQYAREVTEKLQAVARASVGDYVAVSEDAARMQRHITSCDAVLGEMEEVLVGFQRGLADISDEIKQLQDSSIRMKLQLRNRRVVEERLHSFLSLTVLRPGLAKALFQAPVNDAFLACLDELERTVDFVRSESAIIGELLLGVCPAHTLVAKDVAPTIELLRLKAVTRLRTYALMQIRKLGQASTNVQLLQHTRLRPIARGQRFLTLHAPTVAVEIQDAYVHTMSQLYAALFATYHAELLKLRRRIAGKHDVIALDEDSMKGMFTGRLLDLSKRSPAFAIGARLDVLESGPDGEDAELIICHVAAAEGRTFPYEALFRSLHCHLINCASFEFVFCKEYFRDGAEASQEATTSTSASRPGQPRARSQGKRKRASVFQRVFAPVLRQVEDELESVLAQCYDPIAVLLMARLTVVHMRVMARRQHACLDTFLERLLKLLWPRFKVLMDRNVQSLRLAAAKDAKTRASGPPATTNSTGGPGAGERGTSAVSKSSAANPRNTQAHYVSRRFAELAASILLVRRQWRRGEPMHQILDEVVPRLTAELRQLLSAVAERLERQQLEAERKRATARGKDVIGSVAKERCRQTKAVFLINNYDHVLVLLEDRHIAIDAVRGLDDLRESLKVQIALFVETELLQYLNALISFVKRMDHNHLAGGSGAGPGGEAEEAERKGAGVGGAKKGETKKTGGLAAKAEAGAAVEELVFGFHARWKEIIKAIDTDVITYFSNFKSGVHIFQQVLTQLLLYYSRFNEILHRVFPHKKSKLGSHLVNINAIMYEIKRYSRSFDD